MANASAVLNQTLDLLIGPAIDPSEQNVAPLDSILIGQLVQPFTTQPGTVTVQSHRTTGVHVLVGQGTTLTGLARYFVGFWKPRPTWATNLSLNDYGTIGLELFRFGTEVAFGSKFDPTETNIARYWLTGTLMPLPALLNKSGTTTTLVVDIDRFKALLEAANPPPLGADLQAARATTNSLHAFNPFDDNPIPYFTIDNNNKRVPSPVPESTVVADNRQKVLTNFQANAAGGALSWQTRLRWNPYAAVLPIVHLLATLSDSQRAALVNTVFDAAGAGTTAHELSRIAATSAGFAVLRVAFLTTSGVAAATAARARIAAALGIDVSFDLSRRALVSLAVEPPAPAAANLNAKRTNRLIFARPFLGRPVNMTCGSYTQDSGGVWQGPSNQGSIYPKQYFSPPATWPAADPRHLLKDVGTSVGTGTAALTDAQLGDRLAVISAIFDIEGYADAIRAVDKALVSVGMQQFSFHVAEEGTVLLRRIRKLSEVWFDVFFRSAGFEVGVAPLVNSQPVPLDRLQKANVTIAIPELPRPSGGTSANVDELGQPAWLIQLAADGKHKWCVPGTVGLKKTQRAFPTVSSEAPEQHTDCHDAFGFSQNTAGPFSEILLARWAVAARLVPEVIQAQLEMSVHRFNRLVKASQEPITVQIDKTHTEKHPYWQAVFTGAANPSVTLQALFPSPAHAAAIIDCYINTPSAAIGAARRAYDRAVAGWSNELAEAVVINDPRFRVRMLLAYLSERRYFQFQPREGFSTFTQLHMRSISNNVSADRVARLLDRLEEATPSSGLGARVLRWTANFNW